MIKRAVNSGNAEMTKKYLSLASSLTITHHEDFLKRLVVSAIFSKSLSVLKSIIDQYPELLQREYQVTYKGGKTDDCSLLHHAARAGSKEMVKFFVHAGLDVKQRTSEQERTVLGFAASNAHPNVVEYLLKANTTDDILSLGADPIVMAGAGGSVEIFNKMVNVGFDPLDKDKNGQTALHMALKCNKDQLALYLMEQYPSSMHIKGHLGWSTLHNAAEVGSLKLLRHLIDFGVDERHVDKYGCTILHIACLAGKRDAVIYVTQHHECLLQIQNTNGRTALHYASEGGNIDIFKHLVTVGLDVHYRDNDMNNMLHLACYHRNHDMIAYLLQHYSAAMMHQITKHGWSPFHVASRYGDESILRIFMNHNVDICKLTSEGESILHISCRFANIHTTRFILAQFPQLIPLKDNYGKIALEQTVRAGSVDVVKLLRKK